MEPDLCIGNERIGAVGEQCRYVGILELARLLVNAVRCLQVSAQIVRLVVSAERFGECPRRKRRQSGCVFDDSRADA